MSHTTPPSQITNKKGDYYRRGCVHHQKHIFKFKKSLPSSASSPVGTMASSSRSPPFPESQDKLSHLKAIHKKWFNNTITTVTSHRRGIQYQTRYQHLECGDTSTGAPRKYIFCKKYFNPSLVPLDQYRKKTLIKQDKRRRRYDKAAKAITMKVYHSPKHPNQKTIRQAAKVSHNLSPYNKSFHKVIKHLQLSRLISIPEALPYIPTRDNISDRDRHNNPSVKKPRIPNPTDLTNFNPIPDELLAEDRAAQLKELLPFIPRVRLFNNSGTIEFPPGSARWWEYVNKWKKAHQKRVRQQRAIDLAQEKANRKHQQQMDLIRDHDAKDSDEYHLFTSKVKRLVLLSTTLDDQLHTVTKGYQERQLKLIDSPDLLDIAERNRNSLHRLLKKKLPKIFHSPSIEQSDDNTGTNVFEDLPEKSASPHFKLRLNKRVSSFHDHVIQNKRTKLIPMDSLFTTNDQDRVLSTSLSANASRPVDSFKNLYLGRSNPSTYDMAVQKRVKPTHNNGD
ncbi:hypothetical protein RCL_jg25758.t1 [Rhizophagus clarus]|nr:hypothetical protein RCL_jg25758.t1 [Rhizophagus clarus]